MRKTYARANGDDRQYKSRTKFRHFYNDGRQLETSGQAGGRKLRPERNLKPDSSVGNTTISEARFEKVRSTRNAVALKRESVLGKNTLITIFINYSL